MEELKFSDIEMGSKFYFNAERYKKVSDTAAGFIMRRPGSTNPLHYMDELAFEPDTICRQVVRKFVF